MSECTTLMIRYLFLLFYTFLDDWHHFLVVLSVIIILLYDT